MSNIKGIYSPITKKRNIDNSFTFKDYECSVKWKIDNELLFYHNEKIIYKCIQYKYFIEYIDPDLGKTILKIVPLEDVLYEDTLDFLNIQVYDIVKQINLTELNIGKNIVIVLNKKYYVKNEQLLKSTPRYKYDDIKNENTEKMFDTLSNENHNKNKLSLKDLSKISKPNINEQSLSIIAI